MPTFDRSEHVYICDDLEEIIKDTLRFFNGTPVHNLPLDQSFKGVGVYALYYVGKTGIYKGFHEINRTAYNLPIYVGKTAPKGWRQGGGDTKNTSEGTELYSRLNEHSKSINLGAGMNLSDFHCRFIILEGVAVDLIGMAEAALIREHKPLWNSVLDGFGNHDPGKGRYEQAKSDWDVLHVGRKWAVKCKGKANSLKDIKKLILDYIITKS